MVTLAPPLAGRPPKLTICLAFLACVIPLCGCDDTRPRSASASQGGGGQSGSAAEVMERCSNALVAIRTSWDDTSLISTRSRRQLDGPGVILINDGHFALVLASRRLVDPPYDSQGPRSARSITFQVFHPGQGSSGEFLYGHLVAVYMNAADLALVRVEALSPQRLSTRLMPPSQLRAGQAVTLIGRPSDKGFSLSTGTVNNLWPDSRLAGQQLQLSITAGPIDTLGIALCPNGRLAGLVHSRQGPVVMVNCAGQIANADCWEYLRDEGPTRELLGMMQ